MKGKKVPPVSLRSVWLCCQARRQTEGPERPQAGRGGGSLPHIALPSGHFILELGTWNMESHSEPTLI